MKKKKFDWFMILLVVPLALLGAFVLYVGAQDIEEKKFEQQIQHSVDSARQQHRQLRQLRQLRELKTAEDTLHEFEDGF